MIEIKTTRQQLHDIIDTLDDDSVKRIFHYVEDEIDSDWEFTEEFQSELDRRERDYENGVNIVSYEDVKAALKNRNK